VIIYNLTRPYIPILVAMSVCRLILIGYNNTHIVIFQVLHNADFVTERLRTIAPLFRMVGCNQYNTGNVVAKLRMMDVIELTGRSDVLLIFNKYVFAGLVAGS